MPSCRQSDMNSHPRPDHPPPASVAIPRSSTSSGRACARRFAEEGSAVFVADLNLELAAETAQEIAVHDEQRGSGLRGDSLAHALGECLDFTQGRAKRDTGLRVIRGFP